MLSSARDAKEGPLGGVAHQEAERLEAAGNHAAALTKLAAASELFPASRFVSRGMERLSREMLDQARRVGSGQL